MTYATEFRRKMEGFRDSTVHPRRFDSLLLGVYTFRSSDRPVGPTGLSDQSDEAFTRSDRRTDRSARPKLRPTGLSDQSDRPVGQTVAESPTSVNQINVAY